MHWCENMRPEVLLKAAIDVNGRVDCDPNEPAQRFSSQNHWRLFMHFVQILWRF